jgi:hypothetical protein
MYIHSYFSLFYFFFMILQLKSTSSYQMDQSTLSYLQKKNIFE